MAKKLVDLEIDKIAGVDHAANKRTWLIIKRHENLENLDKGGEKMPKDNVNKAGKTISSATASSIKSAAEAIKAGMVKLMSLIGMPMDNVNKGGQMTISKELLEELPEKVKKHFEDLEQKVEKVEELEMEKKELEEKVKELSKEKDEGKKEEDVLKNLPEGVRKRIEDAEEKAAKAEEKAAKVEEVSVTKQYEEEANQFSKMGSPEKIAKILRSSDELGEEEGKEIRETLKAAQAKIDENDLLTKELGRSVSDSVDSAWAKIEAKASELVSKSDKEMTKEQAIKKVLETEEGQALYAEYERSEQ